MKTHYLKTTPIHFEDMQKGIKTAELRKDDREFEVNDTLVLQEWNEAEAFRVYDEWAENWIGTFNSAYVAQAESEAVARAYTGRALTRIVTHILRGEPWLAKGYVMLSLGNIEPLPKIHYDLILARDAALRRAELAEQRERELETLYQASQERAIRAEADAATMEAERNQWHDAFLASQAAGQLQRMEAKHRADALQSELDAARSIVKTLRRHMNAGGEVWKSIDRDFAAYDAAVKGE